ncbi:MAG: AsmA family protein [Mesorhizobium sp.]|nr:AsmA-like C-terminal region-containing protein [Mesorhizobium sp.]MBL8575885.1 AsmA family protein [Mesorhizobium sp.]
MLARLFVIFGGLFVLALTAALVGPYFVDWSTYRADFEREASAILGRKVIVHGEAKARLLPFPSVTFSDVEVGGGSGGEPAMTAETFSMDAELAPLLSGEFRIFDMRLVRPKAVIEVAKDGAIDWAVRPSTPFDASQISIEKLTITEGQVSIRHAASGRLHRLTEINTELSAKSLAGPWRMAGSMRADGLRSDVVVNAGRVNNGAMRMRVQVEPDVYQVSLEFDGDVRFEEGASARYAGDFKLASRNVAEPEAASATPVSPEGPGFRVKGKFDLDSEQLAFEAFRFETGPLANPYSADGRGVIEFGAQPRFAVTLDGSQVRFDEALGNNAAAGSLSLAQRLAALHETLLDLPKPSIPGTLEVNLPAVVAGDTTIRDVRLSAEPASDGWALKTLTATLPGRTTLEANGLLRTEGEFGFKGSMLLAIGQPSGFAAWVARDVDEPIRRLPSAGFQANVDVTQQRQSFTDLELALGSVVFRGEAARNQPANARPSTVLKLEGGALDFDGLTAFASLFVSDVGVNRFSEGDLDLQVKAGPVNATGLTAQSVDAAVRLRDGLLEIDRLSIVDLAGATVSATGTIRDFPANPSGNIDASLVAVDLSPLIAAAAERFPGNFAVQALQARAVAYRGLFEDARLDLVATAAANGDGSSGAAISAQGSLGGTALSATLSAKGRSEQIADADLSITVSGRNDDATELLALYGLPVLPLGVIGPGETEFSLKGRLSGDVATSVDMRADDFTAGFVGTSRLAGGGAALKGAARVNAADIEPWLMTVGATLPAMGAGTAIELEANAVYGNGVLVLDALSGTVNQSSVAGAINVAERKGRPVFSGQLTLDELNLEPFAAMVLGEAALESGGEDWSSVPFAPKVTAPFEVDLGVTAGTLTAGPGLTAYDANLTLKLADEALHVTDLTAKLFGGDLSGLFEMKNNDGTGLLSVQTRLVGADIPTILGDGAGLVGTADISTAISATGKSVGGLVSTLSGSGTAAFRNLVIDGVNTAAFPGLIERADQFGKDIDVARTASFAPALVSSGTFAADPGDVAFTLAAGVLRAPPLELKNAAAKISVNLQSDFNSGDVNASGDIVYDPGVEALVGSEPVVRFTLKGPLGATTSSFDSEPLAQFLTQRALEIEQARVEGMQSALLEKQRLRREVRYYAALQDEHDKVVEEWRRQQEELRRTEEEARLKAEAEEQARQAEIEKARLLAEEQERKDAEERARLAAEEAARQAAEAARLEAEAAAKAEAEEKARLEEAARIQREAEEKARLEAEAAAQEAERAARAEAETRARIEADEQARQGTQEQDAARRAAEESRAAEAQKAREAQNDALAIEEAPPRPPTDVGRPAQRQTPPKQDGFLEMLFGP